MLEIFESLVPRYSITSSFVFEVVLQTKANQKGVGGFLRRRKNRYAKTRRLHETKSVQPRNQISVILLRATQSAKKS